jgi:hypothetical protein
VSLTGRFDAGQAYVAFSRVKSLEGLFIKQFNPAKIKTSTLVKDEMFRLLEHNFIQQPPLPPFAKLPSQEWLTFGYINIRSYIEHLPDLKKCAYIQYADILCFAETFLTKNISINDSTFVIDPWINVIRKDRTGPLCKGGLMIISSNKCEVETIENQVRNTDCPIESCMESMVLKIIKGEHMPLCVVLLYRRPSIPLRHFMDELAACINTLHNECEVLVIGDFNENIYLQKSPVLELMHDKGFKQIVEGPTTDTGSLLDHVYYRGNCSDVKVHVEDAYFSDHDIVFVSMPLHSNNI